MGTRDYYEILGVTRSATADEIKRAYRALAKKYHPDRNADPSADQKFKEVQQAYGVLKDPKKRADYDQFGEAGVGQWGTGPQGERVYQWGGGSVNMDDLEDLFAAFGGGSGGQSGRRASVFDQFFGGGRAAGQRAPQRGRDTEHPVSLTFHQAIHGTRLSLTLRSGRNGHKEEAIDVKVPPGVEHGQRIRLQGKGEPGTNGGPRGDLYLVCSVGKHAYLRRDGADLHMDVPVTFSEAALGGKIDVPTIDGWASLTLPPGTPSGAKLRLKGRGVVRRGGARGDLIVVIRIVPPKPLTDEQRGLLERLKACGEANPRAACPWPEGAAR